MNEHVPVLVVGGGLTGLSAALFLGQHGIRSRVVERHRSTTRHPKARGLNARTMELFRSVGVADRVLAAGSDLEKNHDIVLCASLGDAHVQRVVKSRNDPELSRVSPAQECLCAQDLLEPILLDEAGRLGADIRFGSLLEEFQQDDNGVTAVVDGVPVRADYLIACDGAGSSVRQRLGIGTNGDTDVFHSVGISFVADLADAVPDPFILAYIANPAARGVMLPINNRDRWVFHVRFDPAAGESADDFTEAHCERLIRAATGRPSLDIELTEVAEWETACAVADRYRAGRVFIAGDAAHIMPPAGALGANTGLQDVHNLAWKLAFVLNGSAGPELLDTYETERRPVGEMTTEQALLRWRSSEGHEKVIGLRDDLSVMFGVRYVSRAVTKDVPAQPLGAEPDGTPGTRAPHAWLADGKSTVDLFGPKFTLMYEREHWLDASAEFGPLIEPCRVTGYAESALLVRPDGYVAWRGDVPTRLPMVLAEILDMPEAELRRAVTSSVREGDTTIRGASESSALQPKGQG